MKKRTQVWSRCLALLLVLTQAIVLFAVPVSAADETGTFSSRGGTWKWEKTGTKMLVSLGIGFTDIDGGIQPDDMDGITEVEFSSGITGVLEGFLELAPV